MATEVQLRPSDSWFLPALTLSSGRSQGLLRHGSYCAWLGLQLPDRRAHSLPHFLTSNFSLPFHLGNSLWKRFSVHSSFNTLCSYSLIFKILYGINVPEISLGYQCFNSLVSFLWNSCNYCFGTSINILDILENLSFIWTMGIKGILTPNLFILHECLEAFISEFKICSHVKSFFQAME